MSWSDPDWRAGSRRITLRHPAETAEGKATPPNAIWTFRFRAIDVRFWLARRLRDGPVAYREPLDRRPPRAGNGDSTTRYIMPCSFTSTQQQRTQRLLLISAPDPSILPRSPLSHLTRTPTPSCPRLRPPLARLIAGDRQTDAPRKAAAVIFPSIPRGTSIHRFRLHVKD